MAIEALETRMAKLEGGYEQINERLGAIEQRLTSELPSMRYEIAAIRSEMVTRPELASLQSEIGSMRSEMATRPELASLQSEVGSLRSVMATRSDIAELRRQMNGQFFWLLTFVLGSILIPVLRDLAR